MERLEDAVQAEQGEVPHEVRLKGRRGGCVDVSPGKEDREDGWKQWGKECREEEKEVSGEVKEECKEVRRR